MQNNDIQVKAIESFETNIEFFRDTQPDLYQKIIDINLAIEKGYYEEKYSLEYKDEGYFDVLEIKTNKFLYNSDSNIYAKNVANSINFKKNSNVFETFKYIRMDDDFAEFLEKKPVEEYSDASASKLINLSQKFADKSATTMIKLYKFIFLGVGLGTHLTTLHKKLQSNVYFIIEDDLELFRLSLFITDYKALTDNGAELIFSVFDDDTMFANQTKLFLKAHFTYNHYLKFFSMLNHSDEKLRTIQTLILGQPYLIFNHSAVISGVVRPLTHLLNGYRLMDIDSVKKENIFKKYPVLLLGAGPSFEKNIDWIKKYQDRFIIVAVTALLGKLEEVGIKPDIITHIHGFSDAMPHIQKVKDISFFDKTIANFATFTEPQFIQCLKQDNVYLFEGVSRYKRWNSGLTASNIGTATYGLMLRYEVKNLYLIGLDFALNQDSGASHSSNHEYSRKLKLEEDTHIGGSMEYKDEIVKIKGNLRDNVYASLLMDRWKQEAKSIASSYLTSNTKHIYNLSDGAFIDNTEPLYINEVNLDELTIIDKDKLYDELKLIFMKYSENRLTDDEVNNLYTKINYCTNLIDKINFIIENKYENLYEYHYHLLGLFQGLLAEEKNSAESLDMDSIITFYIQFVSGYIFDLINTKEIEDEKMLISKLNTFVLPQIIRIIDYFKVNLEQFALK